MFIRNIFLLSLLLTVSCSYHDSVNSNKDINLININNDSQKTSINDAEEIKGASKDPFIKIYFDYKTSNNLSESKYVYRRQTSEDPLSFAIANYLNGVNEQEAQMGFLTNNLGITSFELKVEDRTALINFVSEDLHIIGPEQILNFNLNIIETAEQFNFIDDVEICVNGISNYQMSFLSNEESIECPFSF